MDVKLRMYLAELFGTFLVVLVGAGTLAASYLPAYEARLGTAGVGLTVALAGGFTLAVVVTATRHLSVACCNPAVALTLWVCRRLELAQMAALVGVQLLGSFLAGLALRSLFGNVPAARLGTPHLKALLDADGHVTLAGLVAGGALEAVCAFVVTLAVFAALIDRRAPNLGGAVVGMAHVAVVLFGFHLTGGGAGNPALWFGPALWQLSLPGEATARPLSDHAVYWVGPVLGALGAGTLYNALMLPADAGRK